MTIDDQDYTIPKKFYDRKMREQYEVNEMKTDELDVVFLGKKEEEVGRLFIEKGKLSFVGNVDKSAKVFLDYLKELVKEYNLK